MSDSEPSGGVREIDARYLEPPEPFVRAMEAIDTLLPGEKLRLLLFREPFPLYKVLAEHGFGHQTELKPDGTYEILVWKRV